jgi:hypothetical protein
VEDYSFGAALSVLLFDFFFYTMLGVTAHPHATVSPCVAVYPCVTGWYLDLVLPKEFGTRLPPHFCCLPRFWCPPAENDAPATPLAPANPVSAELAARREDQRTPATEQLEREQRCIHVRGVTKRFATPDGTKTAVDDLTLSMYEGQIFALLGHNGATRCSATFCR